MTEHDMEVVDAELADDNHLPALVQPIPTERPLVDRHTIIMPGQDLPTEAAAPEAKLTAIAAVINDED
jgi:hypothetical protein